MTNNKLKDNAISVPAFRYTQGGKLYFSTALSMRSIKRFLSVDNDFDVFKRSQRLISLPRVRKLVNYLSQENYILPPLIGVIDGEYEFEGYGQYELVGQLYISLDCEIKLFDGQHRASSIIEACKNNVDLQSDFIPIMLVANVSLEERQQFFSDINTNVSKPSLSLSHAYNKNDSRVALAMHVITALDLEYNIDFEKTVINNNEPIKIFSFKAFVDSVSKSLSIKKDTPLDDDIFQIAEKLYLAWCNKLNWNGLSDLQSIRKYSILLHGFMLVLISETSKKLLADHDINQVTKIIKQAKFELTDFNIKNWVGFCIDEDTQKIKLDSYSKNRSVDKLISMLIGN